MDPISIARYGLMAATRRFEDAAQEIVGAPDGDTVGAMVDMTQAKQAFAANLSVIRFSQDMWDDLLAIQSR
jgi:flagellar basal body rod protein FlgC